MSVDLRLMRYVIAVADAGGFQNAAARLHIAQPALSRQIRDLEHEFGVELFHRRPTRVTRPGQVFVDDARRILTAVDRAVERTRLVAEGGIGSVRLGYTTSAALTGLPELVDRARRDHPDVEIETGWRWDAELLAGLWHGNFDVAIGHSLGSHRGLASIVLRREPLAAVVPAQHRLAAHSSIALRDLRGETFRFVTRRLAPAYFDLVVGALQRCGETFEVAESTDPRMGSYGVDDLGGFTLAPMSTAGRLPRTVTPVSLTDALPAVDLVVTWLSEATTPATELVLETVRKLAAADDSRHRSTTPTLA